MLGVHKGESDSEGDDLGLVARVSIRFRINCSVWNGYEESQGQVLILGLGFCSGLRLQFGVSEYEVEGVGIWVGLVLEVGLSLGSSYDEGKSQNMDYGKV